MNVTVHNSSSKPSVWAVLLYVAALAIGWWLGAELSALLKI